MRLEVVARKTLDAGELDRAGQLADELLAKSPTSVTGLLIAGYVAASKNRVNDAEAFYSRIPDSPNPLALEGRCFLAQLLIFDRGQAEAAEAIYRRILEHAPEYGLALQGLASLMEAEGRKWELIPYLLRAIRAGRTESGNLLGVGWVQLPGSNREVMQRCRKECPEDPLPLLGLARIAIRENNISQAIDMLQELIAVRPGQLEAQALLGRCLSDSADYQSWLKWHSQVPKDIETIPDFWFARGLCLENQSQLTSAARCFWECCRRDPDHPEASYHLNRVLLQLNEPALAQPFGERARSLEFLGQQMTLIHSRNTNVTLMADIATRLESLGRVWEAWGWLKLLSEIQPNLQSRKNVARIEQSLTNLALQRTRESSNPALAVDLSKYPLSDFQKLGSQVASDIPAASQRIKFADQAAEAGIKFQYFNGRDLGAVGLYSYQTFGGGVLALDYDADGWQDIFLPQGSELPTKSGGQNATDRCFRNQGNGQFSEVTGPAGLTDSQFSHGGSVGDFNNDGFPDIYVTNIDSNRLMVNNGDGTFTDITSSLAATDRYWTCSAVMADFNGDGLPDLFDGTYLGGSDVFTRICRQNEIARACSPLVFPAERDRLYLNLGDGRFQEMSEACGTSNPEGKGLGVVAADFDFSRRLSLFVANDMEANSFFVNETDPEGEPQPRFVEQAVATGLAYDSDGRAQACMGVAVGDANGDGKLDVFVTNYHHESNALYIQQPNGFFQDESRKAGLRDPSFSVLGFGTQFLDADLDGWEDLIVTNGHVDDFTHQGIPFQMQPQLFFNAGRGRFVELPASQLGAYFQGKWLGRGLVRLDWNRDGLDDFAVSHLDRPFGLLTNQTTDSGGFLRVSLRGTTGSRDAIGTTVTATIGKRVLIRQLTAGDGYLASNHHELVFGLGDSPRVDKLEIRWPSGTIQSFDGFDRNQQVLFIEGRQQPVILHVP